MNLILGIIIDTFADLRKEKEDKEVLMRNSCFICGTERAVFDAKGQSFDRHCDTEHNIWSYLNFIVLLKVGTCGCSYASACICMLLLFRYMHA